MSLIRNLLIFILIDNISCDSDVIMNNNDVLKSKFLKQPDLSFTNWFTVLPRIRISKLEGLDPVCIYLPATIKKICELMKRAAIKSGNQAFKDVGLVDDEHKNFFKGCHIFKVYGTVKRMRRCPWSIDPQHKKNIFISYDFNNPYSYYMFEADTVDKPKGVTLIASVNIKQMVWVWTNIDNNKKKGKA